MDRRRFLQVLGASAIALPGWADSRKSLRGIFPIMQTPYTADDKVELAVLAKQVQFLDRCGVHGMVWPQLASEYFNLTKEERLAGAETILAAGKGIRPAIVIGVQGADARTATEYARHATRLGADALIALPPQQEKNQQAIADYYKAIGEVSPLPLFVQAIGDMSVEFVMGMAKTIPTLRYIKDEAGPVLARISEFRAKAPELHPFTGGHGRTLYDEMNRGSAGNMPAAGFADLYVGAWEAFHGGNRRRAAALCARALPLILAAESYGLEAVKYMLHLRGVFPNWRVRRQGGGGGRTNPLDEAGQQTIKELLAFVKADLRT